MEVMKFLLTSSHY